jgi:Fe-S-cluster containining protein
MSKNKWYSCGLHFECSGCGGCCAGPDEGYIWLVKKEVEMLADYLGMSVEDVRKKYLVKVGMRWSIKEEPKSKDCIFLATNENGRGCAIYDVRPNQCRTWPFWDWNLEGDLDWNMAGTKCAGMNKGSYYCFEEIEKIRKQKKWWNDGEKK